MNAILVTQTLLVDGQAKASVAKTLSISASISINNVQQAGSYLQGDIGLKVVTDLGTVNFDLPFSFDTGLSNPVEIDLGSIPLPLFGDVEVTADFYFDLGQHQLCVELTLGGLVTVAKTCVNW